jgi:hypothetical protein
LGKEKTGKVLPKIFDHIVAFVFTMHQDIQPQLFLDADDLRDFRLDGVMILNRSDGRFLKGFAQLPDFGRLRKRANRGRRQERQLQCFFLQLGPLRESGLPDKIILPQPGQLRPERGLDDSRLFQFGLKQRFVLPYLITGSVIAFFP